MRVWNLNGAGGRCLLTSYFHLWPSSSSQDQPPLGSMLQVAVKIFVWTKRQQYTLGFIPLVGQ